MYRGEEKSSSFPQIAGVQWSSTVESTMWGMAPGVAVVLGVVVGLAQIALASWQLQRAAWRRSEGPAGQGLVLVKAGVAPRVVPMPFGDSAEGKVRKRHRELAAY